MIDSFVDSLIVFNLKFLLDSFCDSPATGTLRAKKRISYSNNQEDRKTSHQKSLA